MLSCWPALMKRESEMSMRVLITGAEQGLGLEIYNQISDSYLGAEVINLTGDWLRHTDQFDIQERLSLEHPFDVVINNFGINHLSPIGETPPQDCNILYLNAFIPYWIMNCLARTQGEHPTRVINIASQTYRVAQRHTALYCASKAALVQLSKVVAREMAPHWQVNCVAPGRIVGTEMDRLTQAQILDQRGWKQEEADAYAKSLIPMQRFTDVEEVAELVLSVLSLPDYVTGTVIEAFGGV